MRMPMRDRETGARCNVESEVKEEGEQRKRERRTRQQQRKRE